MEEEIPPIEQRLKLGMTARLKLNNLPRWVHGIGLGGTLIVLLIFVGIFMVFKDVPVWNGWIAASELESPIYGERIYPDSIFRTRMNTWSNLIYILFGFYAIALGIYDWKQRKPLEQGYLSHVPVQSFLMGAAGVYLGLGSGFFHASLTRYGQQCDVGGMYATMFCLAAIAIGSWIPQMEAPRTRRVFPTWPVIAAIVIYASMYFTYYKWDYSFSEVSKYLSGILFLFVGSSLIQPAKYLQVRWFIAALVSIIIGSKVRDLDIEGSFSSPDSVFQGHALWHIISCLFFVFIYLYFRSEERGNDSNPIPG